MVIWIDEDTAAVIIRTSSTSGTRDHSYWASKRLSVEPVIPWRSLLPSIIGMIMKV